MSGWRGLRWLGGESPFGPALVKTPRSVAGLRQLAHRLVCECAEGSAAVGDDLAVAGQIRKVLVELLDGDRARALDMPGLVLLLRANIDQDRVAPRQPLAQLLPADHLDVLAEVIARRPLDLREPHERGVPQGDPEAQRVRTGDLIADAGALALACDHARRVQRLKVLGDIRVGLPGGARKRLDGPWRLGEEIEQLEPDGAGEGLAHHRYRLEQEVFVVPGVGHGLIFNS